MCFVTTTMNRGSKVNAHRLSRILYDVGAEHCLKDHSYRIRKSRGRITHFRQQPRNSASPQLIANKSAFPRTSRDYKPRKDQENRERRDAIRGRHCKHDGILIGTAYQNNQPSTRYKSRSCLRTEIMEISEKRWWQFADSTAWP